MASVEDQQPENEESVSYQLGGLDERLNRRRHHLRAGWVSCLKLQENQTDKTQKANPETWALSPHGRVCMITWCLRPSGPSHAVKTTDFFPKIQSHYRSMQIDSCWNPRADEETHTSGAESSTIQTAKSNMKVFSEECVSCTLRPTHICSCVLTRRSWRSVCEKCKKCENSVWEKTDGLSVSPPFPSVFYFSLLPLFTPPPASLSVPSFNNIDLNDQKDFFFCFLTLLLYNWG